MSHKFFRGFLHLFLLVMVAVLALSACASPTGFGTTQPSVSDQVATIVAGTMQALSTNTPEPPSQDQGEITFRIVMQLGGTFDAVAIEGSTVYLGIGARFTTVDISDPSSPLLMWQSEVLADRPAAIAVHSGLAYLRVATQLLIYNVTHPAQPVLVGTLGGVSGDLFAAGDFVYTFAADSEPQALIAVDVSDPAHPVKVANHEVSATTALAVSGEVLYLVSGGGALNEAAAPGTLQLLNRTQGLSQIALEGAWNYQVAAEGDFAFVVENNQNPYNPDVLLVLDVSNPANPREVARREMSVGGGIVATNKALFLLSRAFPHQGCPAGLKIIDITDPASPQSPTEFDPQSCFNRFAVAGDTLVATSEHGLEIYSVSDPANIMLAGELAPPDGLITADRIALNQNLAYLMTTAGRNRLLKLRVLDMAGPTPRLLNGDGLDLADPEPGGYGEAEVRGDRLYGLEQGAAEVDISDPASPRLITREVQRFFHSPTPARVGNVLYTRLWNEQSTVIVDMGDLANQVVVSILPLQGFATALAAAEGHLFVFSQGEHTSLQVFDVSDPLTPAEVGRLEPAVDPLEHVAAFTIAGDTIYAAGRRATEGAGFQSTLYALDISDPAHPAEISRSELSDLANPTKVVAAGDTIYLRLHDNGILAFDVSDRSQPYQSGYFPLPVGDFAIDGDLLYLAAGDAGLLTVQVEK